MPAVNSDNNPLKVVIPGAYWDSQIYAGQLVLFGRDGTIDWVNWKNIVASLPVPEDLRLVAEPVLLGSAQYYSPIVLRIIQDIQFRPHFEDRFRRLREFMARTTIRTAAFTTRADNPLPFPHNDSEIHYHTLYIGALSGVFTLAGHLSEKLHDVPAFDIAAKHSTIAVAAGSDGLHEVPISQSRRSYLPPSQVAETPCTACEWSYASLVGSNGGRDLFVAAFNVVRQEPDNPNNRRKIRAFDRLISSNQLFRDNRGIGADAIQWGAKDRIYRYWNGNIDVVTSEDNGHVSFGHMKRHPTPTRFSLDTFVDVRVAPFGTVLEFDDRLTILLNSGEIVDLPGEPVNWRVFPRSVNYLNHIHVIYDDRIEILAITSDYFIPPGGRIFGTEPISADE